ncbi:uncharacterized protein FN964_016573 isoform 1-T3 [Alca torda]
MSQTGKMWPVLGAKRLYFRNKGRKIGDGASPEVPEKNQYLFFSIFLQFLDNLTAELEERDRKISKLTAELGECDKKIKERDRKITKLAAEIRRVTALLGDRDSRLRKCLKSGDRGGDFKIFFSTIFSLFFFLFPCISVLFLARIKYRISSL